MNIINAQVEVLKEALKGKSKVWYGTLDNKIIVGNGTRLYIIPKKECGIDLTNVSCAHTLNESILKSFVNDNGCTDIKLTNEIKKLDDKKTVRVFTNGKENIYLDERLIKNFDLEHSTFKGKGANSVIFIYENYNMVGLVLPINIK